MSGSKREEPRPPLCLLRVARTKKPSRCDGSFVRFCRRFTDCHQASSLDLEGLLSRWSLLLRIPIRSRMCCKVATSCSTTCHSHTRMPIPQLQWIIAVASCLLSPRKVLFACRPFLKAKQLYTTRDGVQLKRGFFSTCVAEIRSHTLNRCYIISAERRRDCSRSDGVLESLT